MTQQEQQSIDYIKKHGIKTEKTDSGFRIINP